MSKLKDLKYDCGCSVGWKCYGRTMGNVALTSPASVRPERRGQEMGPQMTPRAEAAGGTKNIWNLKGWVCPQCNRGWFRVWCLDVNHIDLTACFVIECSGEQAHLCHATLSLNESDEPRLQEQKQQRKRDKSSGAAQEENLSPVRLESVGKDERK